MFFTKPINFIFKILILFLRILAFLISKIIIFKFVLRQTSRIGGLVREIDTFTFNQFNSTNMNKTIFILVREHPICNLFLNEVVEKKIKKLIKHCYFFDRNKFFDYWLSSEARFPLGRPKDKKKHISPYDNEGHVPPRFHNEYSYNYDYIKYPFLNFNHKEISKENNFLNNLNLEKKNWICTHNRDSNYLDNLKNHDHFKNMDFKYHNYRDSDVNNLIKSTKLLLENNFYVFRMGRIQSSKMDFKHPNFIDYAFEKDRSDFNDIYLLSNCAAYLGSDSGPGDIPFLSGKPRFLMNYSLTMLGIFHLGGNEMSRRNHYPFIFKHLYDEKTQKKLTLKQVINKRLLGQGNGEELRREGVLPIENSDEEIFDLTLEMVNYLETKKINSQDDYEIQKKFWDIYYENTTYKRFEDIPARICSKFLSKNMYILE